MKTAQLGQLSPVSRCPGEWKLAAQTWGKMMNPDANQGAGIFTYISPKSCPVL